MKTLYSILIAIVAFVMFVPLAVADPGTPWDKKIAGKGRFQVLNQFGGDAVLDKETGRVWEKSPGDTDGNGDVNDNDRRNWSDALTHCYQREVGGRKGWRLPTIEELASLVDTLQPAPTLPAGHPFSNNVQSSAYWSATTGAFNTDFAWGVGFSDGFVGSSNKINFNFVWCVRGGQGIDGLQ